MRAASQQGHFELVEKASRCVSRHGLVTCEFAVSPIRSIKPLTKATSLLLASSKSLNFSDELPAFSTRTLFNAMASLT